jgi:hypothetical protein
MRPIALLIEHKEKQTIKWNSDIYIFINKLYNPMIVLLANYLLQYLRDRIEAVTGPSKILHKLEFEGKHHTMFKMKIRILKKPINSNI